MAGVQFSSDDIYNTCTSLLTEGDKYRFEFIAHELGTIYAIEGFLSIISKSRLARRQTSVSDACRKAQVFVDNHRNFFNSCQQGIVGRSAADNLYSSLCEFYTRIPLRNVLPSLGVGEEQELINDADRASLTVLRSYNLHFSPEARKDRYDLGDQVRDYWREYAALPMRIRMAEPEFGTVLTQQDYFTNAVFPLIKNVFIHAFPGTIAGAAFSVRGAREKNMRQAYVRVSDNGVGISPQVRDRLFERGSSTNQDASQEHGIGLWSVKRFVEQNGGTISVESKPGSTCFTLLFDAD
jgi:anti-sigma regulatory factor (Ser/Thr protein kinase)